MRWKPRKRIDAVGAGESRSAWHELEKVGGSFQSHGASGQVYEASVELEVETVGVWLREELLVWHWTIDQWMVEELSDNLGQVGDKSLEEQELCLMSEGGSHVWRRVARKEVLCMEWRRWWCWRGGSRR